MVVPRRHGHGAGGQHRDLLLGKSRKCAVRKNAPDRSDGGQVIFGRGCVTLPEADSDLAATIPFPAAPAPYSTDEITMELAISLLLLSTPASTLLSSPVQSRGDVRDCQR